MTVNCKSVELGIIGKMNDPDDVVSNIELRHKKDVLYFYVHYNQRGKTNVGHTSVLKNDVIQ